MNEIAHQNGKIIHPPNAKLNWLSIFGLKVTKSVLWKIHIWLRLIARAHVARSIFNFFELVQMRHPQIIDLPHFYYVLKTDDCCTITVRLLLQLIRLLKRVIDHGEFWGIWFSHLWTNSLKLEMLLTTRARVRPAMRGPGCDKIIPFPDYSQTTHISAVRVGRTRFMSPQSTSVVIQHLPRCFRS